MLVTRIGLKGVDGFLIETCEITQRVNDHAYAKIAGVLQSFESPRKLELTSSCLVCANMGLIELEDDGMGYRQDLI